VRPWKVILATAVIFSSGWVVGAFVVKKEARAARLGHSLQRGGSTNAPLSFWHIQQREFIRRMDKELNLTPQQRERIAEALKESQERTKQIREKIAPEMREELKRVRDEIRAELTPEQQEKFEQAMKTKPPRKSDDPGEEFRRKLSPKDGPRRQQTNSPATNSSSTL
jgi:Spy/CpxP family protein refolding chaperone